MKALELKNELKSYVAKDGTTKEVNNFYVVVDFGNGVSFRVQLRPTDYTGIEVLNSYYEK